MQWFKHDTDSTMDYKIKKLLIRYGAVGYAIYFHCLELIAGSINENNITFELEHDSEIIADDLRITGTAERSGRDLVEEIMRYMVELNLFEENNGHIFCFKLLKRLDSSMTSNPHVRKLITEAKENQKKIENHDGVMTESCCSHDGVMLDKMRIDEIRIDEMREDEIRKDENIADKSAKKKPKNTKPKKPKENPYPNIYSAYEKNRAQLCEDGRLYEQKFAVSYEKCNGLIKNLLRTFTGDEIIKVIDNAMNDKWIVDTGYSLSTILSDNQFNKLINCRTGSQPYNAHNEKHTDAQYLADADDPDTIPY